MIATAAEIRASRTPCREIYSRALSSRVSPFITAWLLNLGVTPNQVTVSMLGFGIVGAGLIAVVQHPSARVAGLLAFVLLNVLDTVDGEMARFTGQTSTVGVLLDKVIHVATDFLLYSAIGFVLALESGSWLPVVALWLLLFADAVDTAVVEASRRLLAAADPAPRNGSGGGAFQALAGNVAFYHLFPLFVLADLFAANRAGAYVQAFQTAYFVAYAAAHAMRTLARVASNLRAVIRADAGAARP